MLDGIATDRVVGPLLAAAISALIAVTLWLATRLAERANEARQREAKTADIQRALRAEIRAHVDQLKDADLSAHLAMMTARFEGAAESGEIFVPVVPRETRDTVFRAYLGELHLLPETVVEPVVLYYTQIIAIADMAEDLRSERFATAGAERMAQMYRHFIQMKELALRHAAEAYGALDESLAEERSARGGDQ
ncbi:MAG: hypothetical protein AAF371_13495 [Pseudomonadota bacterium]